MKHRMIRKIYAFTKSMKFGIILLLMIMAIAMLGTFIPQGFDEAFYTTRYSAVAVKFIISLGLNDIYSSAIFIIMFAVLFFNLIMCSIVRLRNIMSKLKSKPSMMYMELLTTERFDYSQNEKIKDIFRNYGFTNCRLSDTEETVYYSIKNKAGYFGSWILHFGILLVIAYYAYGHATYYSEGLYGVAGTVQTIAGTDYKAKLEDFQIEYREDGSVQQYTSKVKLIDEQGNSLKSSYVSVNNPMRFKGYTFYQTSYGWAANCFVTKSGNKLAEDTLYEKTSMNIPKENIAIYFYRFYPDFISSKQGFMSQSDQLLNPIALCALLYMGEIVKMDIVSMGQSIQWNQYEVFIDRPMRYTYLDINRMRGQIGALVGAIFIVLGLLLVFYFKPVRMVITVVGEKLFVYGEKGIEKINDNKEREKNV